MRKSCSMLKEMGTDAGEPVAVKAARRVREGEVRKGLAQIPPEGISGGSKRTTVPRWPPTLHDVMPFQIDMLFIRDERDDAPEISDEEAAKFASWIADILKRGGKAELVHWEILSTKNISVYDYSNAYELPTDQYSLDEDDNTSD